MYKMYGISMQIELYIIPCTQPTLLRR